MTIRVKCDGCGSVLKIKDELAGKEGSCPKCKAEFKIPAAEAGSASAAKEAPAASETSEPSEEDDIFGKDFFKMSEVPTKPKYAAPKFDDEPVKEPAKKPVAETKKSEPEPERSNTKDAAADIASKLLAKTGKKNKSQEQIQAEIKAEEDNQKVDLTEVKYLITHKILPLALGTVALVFGLYWISSSMIGDKAKHPDLGTVTGVVTLDGKFVPNADVRFTPVSGSGPNQSVAWSQSYGTTDAQGAYSLSYTKDLRGGVIGPNKVQVFILGRPFEKDVEVKSGTNDIPLAFQSN